jgi:hypothetical protein
LSIAVDDSGNAYITGQVASTNFPVVSGFQDTLYPGSTDAFVCKLNPSGSALLYSTYFGGAGGEYSISFGRFEGDIVLDDSGYVYIAGHCQGGAVSPFPTTPGAFQTVHPGSHDAFVAKFNTSAADAASLIYCTFVGGFSTDAQWGLAVDAAGNACITGYTISSDWPTTPNAYLGTYPGALVGYVTKLNSTGTALLYSSFVGTASSAGTGFDCEADPSGNVYVAGTAAAGFPTTAGAYQTTFGGAPADAYLAKFNTNASGAASLVYSTYLGGGGSDQASGVDIDSAGNVYLAGVTASANFPTKDSVQGTPGGLGDLFMTKLNPAASGAAALVFSTYLGGTLDDAVYDQAIDACGNVYVAGVTQSTNFPTQNPYQANYGGGNIDGIVVKLGDAVCAACAAAKGDMNASGGLSPADVVLMLNCVFLGTGDCDFCFADVNCSGGLSPADAVIELNMVFLGAAAGC